MSGGASVADEAEAGGAHVYWGRGTGAMGEGDGGGQDAVWT